MFVSKLKHFRFTNYRLLHGTAVKPSRDLLSYDLITQFTKQDDAIPPILFLHGFLGNRRNNKSAAKSLSEQLNIPVIVPDLRNHGSSFHSEIMDYEVMSDDLTHLINSLPLEVPKDKGFIILGHSMGAKVAMIHGLRYPKQVKGVISIDNVPYANPESSFNVFQKFHIAINVIIWCLREHPEWDIKQLKNYLLKWIEPNTMIVNYYLMNVTTKQGKIVEKVPLKILKDSIEDVLLWKMKEFGDIDQFIGQPEVGPLLLIRANYSNIVGTDVHTHAISKYFHDYEVEDINTSHWVVTDNKAEFVSIVKSWVLKKFKS